MASKAKNPQTDVDRIEAFLERAALAQAPAWRPEPGDVLSGTILGFRMGSTVEYGDYPVVIISSTDGPVAFHCFHELVRERLRELKPEKGTPITVQYGGKREVTPEEEKAGKHPYHKYYIEAGTETAAPISDTIDF